jgi:hypothetical protein
MRRLPRRNSLEKSFGRSVLGERRLGGEIKKGLVALIES